MAWNPETPYNDLPPLPPQTELETRTVLKATIEARASVARLDQAARLLPNPSVLLNAAPILEAQASSEIENIVTTADELFKHARGVTGGADQSTKEALRYRQALVAGVSSLAAKPLTTAAAGHICSVILGRDVQVRALPGTRIANPATGDIVYAPPEGAPVILDKLTNWERFLHADCGLDPLVRMAVAHYQFEAIHPFGDGNGRTGRILNILMLIEAGLVHDPILYLSRRIIATKNDYYSLLRAVARDAAWEPWILYMLNVVRHTAESTVAKIADIRELQLDFRNRARAATVGGRNADLLNVLFDQPYCRIATVIERCDVSRPTATGWLNDLVDSGLLTDHRIGRDRLFLNDSFLQLLVRDEHV